MNRASGDTILIGGACLFASWTVFCYVMVFAKSGFSDLMMWSFVPLLLGLAFGCLCIGKWESTDGDYIGRPSGLISTFDPLGGSAFILLVLVVIATILRIIDAPYWSIWIALLCATILVVRTVSTSSKKPAEPLTPNPNWESVGVITLIVFGALLVAITHRVDIDDSQYLNFVVTALDFPLEPLYSHSGLWRDNKVPLELPLYRFHSYELLVAAFSHAFDVGHKIFYYLILPPIFGGAAVLVHWRLAKHLVPRQALSFLLVWLIMIIALGESHRAFGNFAFVRLHQGKGLLVTVALPLCLLLGLRFAEAPNWRRALALGMTAIASIGISSSALVTVPAVLAAALAGGLSSASRTAFIRIIAGGLVASLGLVAIGVILIIQMEIGNGNYGDALPNVGFGLSQILGEGILGAIVLALFPTAPLFVTNRERRRIYAIATLIFVMAVLNPWVAPFLAEMFDLALQWRLFWSVPLVTSASISVVGLAALVARKLPPPIRPAVLPVMLVAILLTSTQLSISPDNKVVIAFPHYKVESFEHALAGEIARNAPQRSTIYAPISIAAWIPTFRHHPYPIVVRRDYFYFRQIQDHVGVPEIQRRTRVIDFIEGLDKQPSTLAFFQEQLKSDLPTFVVYERYIDMAPLIGTALENAGYVSEERGPYWLWQRR